MNRPQLPLWALTASLLVLPLACQNAGPATTDPHATMQSVAMLLERGHVSQHPLDDSISEQAFEGLFERLDPLRVFFVQGDLEHFAADRDRLDDYLRAGDPTFAERVGDLLRRRVDEAAEMALSALDAPTDFGADESIANGDDALPFARTRDELADRWRRRVKLDRLALEYNGVADADAIARLRQRYTRMAEREREPDWAVGAFIDAITQCYDPHTLYFSPRTAEDFQMMIRLNYEGIGAVLGSEDGLVVVRKIMPGGSAEAAGTLMAGDVILAVGNGRDGVLEVVDGLPLDQVVDRIRGPEGTEVRLQVSRDGGAPRIVALERRKTELVDQFAKGEVLGTGAEKVGWIELPGFYADPDGPHSATRDVARLIEGFRGQGVGAIVLDLRENGGGLLSEAVTLTGLFLHGQNVVRVRDTVGRVQAFDDPDRGALWDGPLVVLVSRFSASASEILAGAIQDEGRGLVVGDSSTHGKGSVQTVFDLERFPVHRGDAPQGSLKLTTQQFFRPDGASTQRRGVEADIVLPAWSESVAEGEAALPHALPFRRIEPLTAGRTAARAPALIEELTAASAKRVDADPDFEAVRAANRERGALRQQHRIPLTREGYAAWREAMKRAAPDPEATAALPEYYRREVCRIAADYAAALDGLGVPVAATAQGGD